MAASLLDDLSNELIIEILSCLTHTELARCRQLCKQICLIVDETPLLQYIIEYGAAGYPEDLRKTTQILDELEHLRKVQRIYRNPSIVMPLKTVAIADFVPKWEQPPLNTSRWHSAGDVIIGIYEFEGSSWLGRISLSRGIPDSSRFSQSRLSGVFDRVFADRAEDLLIAENDTTLCFLSFSTGQLHPKLQANQDSQNALLQATRATYRKYSTSGEWLLIEYINARESAPAVHDSSHIIHWPSCRNIKSWPEGLGQNTGKVHSGCIIGDYVMIPMSRPGCTYQCQIEVFHLPRTCGESTLPTLVAIYGLSNQLSPNDRLYFNRAHAMWAVSRETSRQYPSLLELKHNDYLSYIHVSAIITTSVKAKDTRTPPLEVAWDEWRWSLLRLEGKSAAHLNYISGVHFIYHDGIVDFNEYDIARDIYAPEVPHGHKLRSSSVDQRSGRVEMGREVKKPAYRFTDLRLPFIRGMPWYCLLEDKDGPYLVQIASYNDRPNPPCFLVYISFQ